MVAAFFFFGSSITGFFGFGGEDELLESVDNIADSESEGCEAVFDELRGDADLEPEDFADLTCQESDGEVIVRGEVANDATLAAVAGVVAATSFDGDLESDSFLTVPEVEEVAAAPTTTAAPAPTTTAAPAPTTTAAPETTTTAAPETTTTTTAAPEPTNMWQALNNSGQAGQFAIIGGALGLQENLESTDIAQRTLFAPNDEALGKLDPSVIPALQADADAAGTLVGYHFLGDAFTAEELAALDGEQLDSLIQLPIDITVVDGEVILNGVSRVVATDFDSDNGIVHIIDTVLTPPTVNQIAGIENIEFEVNSDVITAAGQTELQKAIDFFTANPTVNATIEGHTDTDGSDVDNLDLSERRAESVRQFLITAGIEEGRLTAQGFGETNPILVDGVEDKPASRRIEFRVR